MNLLSKEKNPYLKQHQNNPVHWLPWCEEAFERAHMENKPIFLSIGYSSCHWCHVMEKESFEDLQVAQYLNENFISIKVDREERPDIDSLYMLVCQMMTGQGGWPLSLFLDTERNAFFAGTYFPKKTQQGRIGFFDLLKKIRFLWDHQTQDLKKTTQTIRLALEESQRPQSTAEESLALESLVRATCEDLKKYFEPQRGGFGRHPKFPSPHKLLFLLSYYRFYPKKEILEMVETTLQNMHRGGIFDHLHGGFHRYSTDESWELPHFEKMLYDQAMCLSVYLDAYQLTKNPLYSWVAESIIDYTLENLRSLKGGFFSAYDADSEHEEGLFYLWSIAEMKEAFSETEFLKLEKVFCLQQDGNYVDEATHQKTNKNILFLKQIVSSNEKFKDYLECQDILKKLKKVSQSRTLPLRDEKILLDWNALFLKSLLKAYEVFGTVRYLEQAQLSWNYLKSILIEKNKIFHSFCEDSVLRIGFLDDYAQAISVSLDFYQITKDDEFLEQAVEWADFVLDQFWDPQSGGFFLSQRNQNSAVSKEDSRLNSVVKSKKTDLIFRTRDFYDGAYPSGNSSMLSNCVRLWHLTGQGKYEKILNEFLKSSGSLLQSSPSSYCDVMKSFVHWYHGAFEIQILGDWNELQKAEIQSVLRNYYLPEKYIQYGVSQHPQIQVCRLQTCSAPVFNIEDFKKLLEQTLK